MTAEAQNNPTRNFLRNFRSYPDAIGMKPVMCVNALREKAGPSVHIVLVTVVADLPFEQRRCRFCLIGYATTPFRKA
jgi:hypothetical protein